MGSLRAYRVKYDRPMHSGSLFYSTMSRVNGIAVRFVVEPSLDR